MHDSCRIWGIANMELYNEAANDNWIGIDPYNRKTCQQDQRRGWFNLEMELTSLGSVTAVPLCEQMSVSCHW